MKLSCILFAILSCTVLDGVRSQMPPVPMPPIPQAPMPMLHDARVRRSAQVPEPPMPPGPPMPPMLEQRNRRSAQTEAPPSPLEQRNRRSPQAEKVPPPAPPTAPLETRNRRSASNTPMGADFHDMSIVGNVASQLFGIRTRREARGGRMPTTNG